MLLDWLVKRNIGDWWDLKVHMAEKRFLTKYVSKHYFRIMDRNVARIMPAAKFKSKPALPHGLSGIFVSSGSRVRHNAVIFHQVTIGSVTTLDSKKYGSPIIGDNCYIGAGAKIVGRIKVGNNVIIGANIVVYDDVPDNSIVTNGPQCVITKETTLDNNYYFPRKGVWHYAKNGDFIMCPNDGEKPMPDSI